MVMRRTLGRRAPWDLVDETAERTTRLTAQETMTLVNVLIPQYLGFRGPAANACGIESSLVSVAKRLLRTESAPAGRQRVASGKARDRLKTLSVGPSALDLLTWSVSWGSTPGWYRAGLRPLHLVNRSGLTRIESAESALHISLGRSPRNRSQTKESRAVSPPHHVLRRSRSAARGLRGKSC